MEKYGYITSLRTHLYKNDFCDVIGEFQVPEELLLHPLNPSTIFIAKKRNSPQDSLTHLPQIFACPLTKSPLIRQDGFWLSSEGPCYPEINGFPLLRSKFGLPYYQQAKYLRNQVTS